MMISDKISIETFCKKAGGRTYKTVRFYVTGCVVEVGDFQVDTDEKAMEKAVKALKDSIKLVSKE